MKYIFLVVVFVNMVASAQISVGMIHAVEKERVFDGVAYRFLPEESLFENESVHYEIEIEEERIPLSFITTSFKKGREKIIHTHVSENEEKRFILKQEANTNHSGELGWICYLLIKSKDNKLLNKEVLFTVFWDKLKPYKKI